MVKSNGQKYNINLHLSSFFGKTLFRCIFVALNKFEMKRNIIALSVVLIVILITSCGQSIEKKLVGTWKVADVQTEFNETEVTPEMLRQVVDLQKQTYFRIINDSTMVIISNNNTYEAGWVIDEETSDITYFFDGMEAQGNQLGNYTDGQIVNETKTALGSMTITYKKEK